MKRKLISALVAAVVICTTISGPAVQAATTMSKSEQSISVSDDDLVLSNDVLEIICTSTGDFSIRTTQGDPDNTNDDFKRMIFGKTNAEAVRVDNKIINLSSGELGPDDSLWSTTKKVGNKLVSSYAVDNNITITRTITLINSPTSTLKDSVKFDYAITNKSALEQDISLKTMLDTYVGDNDSAPFSIPGLGKFNTGKKLTGDSIPSYWFAYDSLTEPTAITKEIFPSNCKPDMLDFTKWSRYDSDVWEQTVNEEYENGDSSVVMYWNNKKLAPNATKTFTHYYSVGTLNTNISENLAVSLLNGSNVTLNANSEGLYDPYETTVTVENVGEIDTNNVQLEISIPEQFRNILSVDGPTTYELGNLTAAKDLQQNLKFNIANGEYFDPQIVSYDITVKSTGAPANKVTQSITINPNHQRSISATLDGGNSVTIKPNSDNEYDLYSAKVNVKNLKDETLENATVKIEIPEEYKNIVSLAPIKSPGLNGPGTDDPDATIHEYPASPSFTFDPIGPNAEFPHNWDIKINPSYENRVVKYNVVVSCEGEPDIVLSQTLNIDGLVPPQPETPETPETPDNSTSTTPTKKPATTSPKTADPSNFAGLLGTALLSLGGIISSKKKYKPKH